MRSLIAAFTVACSLFAAPGPSKKADGMYTASAYSVEGETASGRMAKPGVVAADPDILPLGSKIQISGAGPYSGTYTVADTGRKISGREIDIYIAKDGEATKFGKKQVRVKVLSRP